MPGYTRKEFEIKLQKSLLNIDNLYQEDFINYRGKTTDTKEVYTEIVSEVLLSNLDIFDNITTISRKSSYKIPNHYGVTGNDQSNRIEERIALSMYNKQFDHIGKVIDYQVPMKNVQGDKNVGKIDLIALKDNALIVLELKKEDSKETLLRCVLEAATYFRKIHKDKLLRDFADFNINSVETAVLVFKDKAQHNEYKNEDTNTRRLMKELKVDMYVIKEYDSIQVFGVALP